MAEPITEEDIISEWTIAVEALDIASIQQLIDLRPNLLWTPLKNSSHLESDFDHFVQRLKKFGLLGSSIRPVYALHHILFDYGLPGDEWMTERVELVDFILKNTKGDELNSCVWGKEENTTMHLAYLLNQADLILQLTDKGASTSIPNKLGHLPSKEGDALEAESSSEEDEEESKEDIPKETNSAAPTLIINKKDTSQAKERVPLNASDKFKRLRELAESPGNNKKTERQNSTRRYFRPGHLEERKRRVLSEEEEAELEKQRLLRQKDIALLAQRSAVKNNPLFKKFEEQQQQQQQQQQQTYKANPIRSAASIMRDRRKLLNTADQIKRSSRVINSLKENSYVTSSIFRQQAAQIENNTLPIPKLRSRAPSPISRESTPNTSDTEEDSTIIQQNSEKAQDISPAPTIVIEEAVTPQISTSNTSNTTTMATNTTKSNIAVAVDSIKRDDSSSIDKNYSRARSPSPSPVVTDKENTEISPIGKLKKQDLFGTKQTTKPNVDIVTSKVKEIINVHEHLNDEEEIEIYSTGKVFSVWKKEHREGQPEDEDIREYNKAQSNEELVDSLKPRDTVDQYRSLDSTKETVTRSPLSKDSSQKSSNETEQRFDTTDSDPKSTNINKLKFGGFNNDVQDKNEAHINRLELNMNENNKEKNWTHVNKLKFDKDTEMEDDSQKKGLKLNGYSESSGQTNNTATNRLQLNRSDDDLNHVNKQKYDNDSNAENSRDIRRGVEETSSLESGKNELNIHEESTLNTEKSINKLNILERGVINQTHLDNNGNDVDKKTNNSHENAVTESNPMNEVNENELSNQKINQFENDRFNLDEDDDFEDDENFASANQSRATSMYVTDDSASDTSYEDASRGSNSSFNLDGYHSQNEGTNKSKFDDLEYDDQIRFDDDEDVLGYQPSKDKQLNNWRESLIDKDINGTSDSFLFHQDTNQNENGTSQYRQYEPYNNAIPISAQTVLEEEYESDEEGAKTPTLANPNPAEPDQWQTAYDKLLVTQQTNFEPEFASKRDRFSTSSSINETSILNTLHTQQKEKEDEIWHEENESENWYESQRRPSDDDSSSRNSSNYSFKNSNSTEITRMDSDDDDRYYKREQQHDVVIENKATIQQDEDDEDEEYYSTALHQREPKQSNVYSHENEYHDEYYNKQRTMNQQGEYYSAQRSNNQEDEYHNKQRSTDQHHDYYSSQTSTKQEDSYYNTREVKDRHLDISAQETSRTANEYQGTTTHKDDHFYTPKKNVHNLYSVQGSKSEENGSSSTQSLKTRDVVHTLYSVQGTKSEETGFSSTQSFKTRESESKSYGDGEIVVFMDSPNIPPQSNGLLSPYASSQQHLEDDTRSLIRVPSQTNTIYAVGQENSVVLEDDTPHDPKNPRIEDISHYLKVLPSLRNNKNNEGTSAFDTTASDDDHVMVKRVKSSKEAQENEPAPVSVPNAHEFGLTDFGAGGEVPLSSMDVSGYGKMYIGVSGAHHVILPLPKEITYVRIVISDGEYEYMSRYEILTEQILMDYECVIDTKPGMIITVSLHVRPDYHVRPKTGWSRWFTSIRKQKEHLSGYVYPEDGAIGQTRFAVDHMIPGCYKRTYQAYFDCFNSWYARTYQERMRREKFGDEEDFLKIVGKLNIEMLYLPVSSPSVHVPRSLRECDLTLKILQWHETCWQSGYLSLRRQGTKVWERHYYRLIGSQLIGYTTEENGRTRQVYNHFNIADVIRLSAAADKIIVTLVDEDTSKVFTESMHTENNEKGFFRLTFNDYYVDCVSDTMEESEEWVNTLKSMIGHVQRFHYILDGIKNIF